MNRLQTFCMAMLWPAMMTAQIGTRFPSERKVITDPKTGVELVFLTSKSGTGDSKIYQTHNQWTSDGRWVIFRSDRVKGYDSVSKHGWSEAMAVNEETGEMVQVTEGGFTGMLCVARKSMNLYIMRHALDKKGNRTGMEVVEINLEKLFADSEAGSLKKKQAYERVCGVIPAEMCSEGDMALDGSETFAYFRLDKDYAGRFPIAEPIASNFGPRKMGSGPGGIGKIDLTTGKCEPVVAVHFKVGHIQGNPWKAGEVIFCWETGGKAPQRTWICNADGSGLRPVYRETEHDWVTHEAVISADELVIAIIGHRPIGKGEQKKNEGLEDFATSSDWGPSGTKAYPTGIAVVNMRTRELTMEGQVAGDNFWHVGGSSDGHWLVGDDFARELWLIDRHTGERILLTAGHKTTARDHVHPTFKPDGTEIEIQSAMLSDDGRSMNICIVKLPQHLLDRYKKSHGTAAQTMVNDTNTPLHLLKPAYKVGYGIPKAEEVKQTMDRVLKYIDSETPAVLVDKRTGKEVTDLKQVNENTQLKQGGFRLTSYEWGVTYSGVLSAYEATGDAAYRDYVVKRHRLLADIAPVFRQLHRDGKQIDGNVRRVVDPHALDDAGAVCCSMIKNVLSQEEGGGTTALHASLRPLIDNYADYILNKEYRLSDGTFARLRPQKNTVWLDDMFMGIPAVAYMGRLTGERKYYDEAARQVVQFAARMWVEEEKLFRHGWVEAMLPHPSFFWGRANGWAILTMCEVLDVLPADHPQRQEILNLLQSHAAGLAALQGNDGFWHQLLNRTDSYPETSATAIYTYCLAHAINQGWLDAKAYGAATLLGWHAVNSAVNSKGQVEGVCVGTGMGFDPSFYAYRPVHVMAAHGYGPVIWAGAEVIRLLKSQYPKMNDSAVHFYDQPVPTDKPIFNYDGKIRF